MRVQVCRETLPNGVVTQLPMTEETSDKLQSAPTHTHTRTHTRKRKHHTHTNTHIHTRTHAHTTHRTHTRTHHYFTLLVSLMQDSFCCGSIRGSGLQVRNKCMSSVTDLPNKYKCCQNGKHRSERHRSYAIGIVDLRLL